MEDKKEIETVKDIDMIPFKKDNGHVVFHLEGKVRMVVTRNGEIVKDTGFQENQITSASFPVIAGLLGNTGSQVAFTYLAVGSGTTAENASLTALTTEITNHGLARVAANVSRVTSIVTNDTLQLSTTWTASGGSSDTVQEIGIFNASSGGTMLGRKLTGAIVVPSGDTLTATYQVQVVGN